jgi:hypothetical protein
LTSYIEGLAFITRRRGICSDIKIQRASHPTIRIEESPHPQYDHDFNHTMALSFRYVLLCLVILIFASQANAFGAGSKFPLGKLPYLITRDADRLQDIASISAVEGKNWRHGDIEDILKQVQCIRKHKWNSMMMKRMFGTLAKQHQHR